MADNLNDDNVDAQVDKAVADTQTLGGWKEQLTAELGTKGIAVEGATVHVAHTLDGQLRVDNLGEVRTPENDA